MKFPSMKNTIVIFTAIIMSTMATAHEAPKHDHAQLIPIPEYSQPYGQASAASALKAAQTFLNTFDNEGKSQFIFNLDAPERSSWSNLPAGIVERTGISIAELTDEQRKLLFEFLASSLGEEGYQSVMEVMAAEAFLSADKRAQRLKWDPQNYWLSFFGTPAAHAAWGWQYGGHHLGLNISVENNVIETMSPSFIGTEPAIFTLNGVEYEAVMDMHRAGYSLYISLDTDQQAKADAGAVPEDVLTGPGQDGTIPQQIGIPASEMNAEQKTLLLAAISEWVTIQPEENATPRISQIESELDQITFAWTGTDEVNTPTYMRIQGPTLIIELLSTGGNVGESAKAQGHYHTMYRNPTMEYGG